MPHACATLTLGPFSSCAFLARSLACGATFHAWVARCEAREERARLKILVSPPGEGRTGAGRTTGNREWESWYLRISSGIYERQTVDLVPLAFSLSLSLCLFFFFSFSPSRARHSKWCRYGEMSAEPIVPSWLPKFFSRPSHAMITWSEGPSRPYFMLDL